MLRLTDTRGVRRMSRLLPRLAVRLDLLSLLDVQRLAALVVFQRRALKVHAEFRRPARRSLRACAPPDAIEQAFWMRLDAQQPRRIGKHRSRVRLRKPLSLDTVE
jgi:hypothetical protein